MTYKVRDRQAKKIVNQTNKYTDRKTVKTLKYQKGHSQFLFPEVVFSYYYI